VDARPGEGMIGAAAFSATGNRMLGDFTGAVSLRAFGDESSGPTTL